MYQGKKKSKTIQRKVTLLVIVTLTRLPKSSGLTPTRWIRPSRRVKARLVTASVTRLSHRADRSDTLLYTIFSSSFIAGIHLVNQINHSNSLLLNQRNKKDIGSEIVKKRTSRTPKKEEEVYFKRPEKVKKELLEHLEPREKVKKIKN